MKNVAPMHSAVKNSRNGIRPVPRSESAPRTGETRALIPTLMTTAIDSTRSRRGSPNWSTRYSPIAPDTTANEKIVLAKSYSAHDAGTIARPLGVSAPSPRAVRGADAGPLDGALLVTGRSYARRRVRSSDVGRHVPARTGARSPGARRPATAGLRERPAVDRSSIPIVEPLWTGAPRARRDRLGRRRARRRRRRSDGRPRFDRRGAGRGGPVRRGGRRRLHHQAGDARAGRGRGLVRRDAVDGQHDRPAAEPGDGHGQAQGDLARGEHLRGDRRAGLRRRSTCSGSTTRRSSTSPCSSDAGCSRPWCSESDGVRLGAFVRPPIEPLARLVALAGLRRVDLQGRQQPLPAGPAEPRLGDHAACPAAETRRRGRRRAAEGTSAG